EHRRLEPGGREELAQPLDSLGFLAAWLAERELVAVDVLDNARLHDLGRRIDDAADRALGTENVPLLAAAIHRFQPLALPGAAMAIEVPVGDTVIGRDHGRVVAEQWPHRFDRTGHRMR